MSAVAPFQHRVSVRTRRKRLVLFARTRLREGPQACRLPVVLGLVLLLAAVTQGQVVIGTVKSATASTVHIKSSAGDYTLFRDSATKIWRGRFYSDFSALHPGDEVDVRCRREPDGRLVVVELYANIDHLTGLITRIDPSGFRIDQNFDADPHSGYRRGPRDITYNSETAFENCAPEDLRVGRTVDIIGLKLGQVAVRATRVTIYEGKRPVRMPPGSVLPPNGSRKELKQ